jgi:hypothetical protein
MRDMMHFLTQVPHHKKLMVEMHAMSTTDQKNDRINLCPMEIAPCSLF